MKIAPREQFILTVVASVVVVVALIGLLIYPSYRNLSSLDDQIALSQANVSTAQSLLSQRQSIKDRSAQTDAKWIALANQVPDNPDLPALIIELQDAAFDSGVQLVSVAPAKPANLGTYTSVPVNIEILGTWADTIDYLQRITKLSRGLRVSLFSSLPTNNEAQMTRANAELPAYFEATSISLEAYMIPASAGTTSTTVPAPAGP